MALRLGPVATAALLAALLHNAPPGAAQFIGGGFTNSRCDFASFQARAAEVTVACCEGKGDEVCPAGWKPGDDTMKPDPDGSKEYFASI